MNLRFQYRGVQISPWQLPDFARDVVKEEVKMGRGVGEIEAMLGKDDEGAVKLGLPEGSTLVAYMNQMNDNPYQNIERIYWAVSTTAIRGVLDRIRTALVELVAELRHGMPEDAALPPPDLVTQAVRVAVGGKNNRVVVTAAHSGGEALGGTVKEPEPGSPGWRRWTKIGAAVVGLAGIVAAVFAVLQYLAT